MNIDSVLPFTTIQQKWSQNTYLGCTAILQPASRGARLFKDDAPDLIDPVNLLVSYCLIAQLVYLVTMTPITQL